jgi:hypothetical protein
MKGLLYIIPADPKAIRERCEITAPPTIEELRKIIGDWRLALRATHNHHAFCERRPGAG